MQISALCVLQLWKNNHALQYIAHHITTTNVRTHLHFLKSSLPILREQRTVQHNIAITPHDTCVCSEIAPLSSYERWLAPLTFSSVFSNSTASCSITLAFLPCRLAYYERVLLTWHEFSNTTLSFAARTLTLLFLCWTTTLPSSSAWTLALPLLSGLLYLYLHWQRTQLENLCWHCTSTVAHIAHHH